MTIKDLASKIKGNVTITVMTSDAEAMYDRDGKYNSRASLQALNENTLIEFKSEYWDKLRDDVLRLDVNSLWISGNDDITLFVDAHCHGKTIVDYADNKPVAEELLVETEAELIDAMQDDSFGTVRLACNIDLANTLAVYDTTKVLDLAGYTLSADKGSTIQVGEGADLTVTGDGVVHGNFYAVTVVDGGKVTLDDGAYICNAGAGPDIVVDASCVVYVKRGKAIINGGAFSNANTNGHILCATEINAAVIEAKGGKFVGEDPIEFTAHDYIVNIDKADGTDVYTVQA